MNYKEQYNIYLTMAEQRMTQLNEVYLPANSRTAQAAKYSLMAGGKRVRSILVLAACDLLKGDVPAAADLAAAVEMVHCFSLIHDDLPCMDNDDYRRGKLSCHKAYDYATALLAGDALVTEAFSVVANSSFDGEVKSKAAGALALGTGLRGMIYGQELDLIYESSKATEAQLLEVHRHKTGALINASVQMGAIAAGATEEQRQVLESYAYGLGLVFQIVDDVLDVTSTSEELGKPVGSDEEQGKTTFVSLYGVEGAMKYAQRVNNQACALLEQNFGERAAFLTELARLLLERKK